MNYLKEINSLYDRLETNPLSAHAIALWHALMATANKAGWVSKFTVAISTLEAKTSLNKKAIERARNELSQKGYIEWNKRNGNQSAEYSIISLCDKKDIDIVAQSVSQDIPQSVAINKLKETKEKEIIKEKVTLLNGEEKIISKRLSPFLTEMLSDTYMIECLCMNNHLEPDILKNYIKQFFVLRSDENNQEIQVINDAQSYFSRWLRYEIEKGKKDAEKLQEKPKQIYVIPD